MFHPPRSPVAAVVIETMTLSISGAAKHESFVMFRSAFSATCKLAVTGCFFAPGPACQGARCPCYRRYRNFISCICATPKKILCRHDFVNEGFGHQLFIKLFKYLFDIFSKRAKIRKLCGIVFFLRFCLVGFVTFRKQVSIVHDRNVTWKLTPVGLRTLNAAIGTRPSFVEWAHGRPSCNPGKK